MLQVSGVRIAGPLECYAEGFAAELGRRGYTPNSARGQLFVAAHLSRWLSERGVGVEALTPELVGEFFAVRRAADYTNYRTVRAAVPLLSYLRGLGAVTPPPPVVAGPVEALLARFGGYLAVERGLAAGTVRGYTDAVRRFIDSRQVDGQIDLAGLTAEQLTLFVVAAAQTRSQGSVRMLVCGLRAMLRWAYLDGMVSEPLAGAVPSVASWRQTGLPRGIDPEEVASMLACCDRATTVGLRDFAVLTVLVRLGLRAGEVASLSLDDIDWRSGQLSVQVKGGGCERLPLPVDVGAAIVAWLREGRPVTAEGRTVFVRVRAPHGPLSRAAVTGLVVAAGRRAGLARRVSPHRLRHTTATGVLAAGAPLEEVGQLLGHRRRSTTAIYAKVDHRRLASIARPWPAGGGR